MTSPSVLLTQAPHAPVHSLPPRTFFPLHFGNRVAILAFGFAAGFIVAAAMMQVLPDGNVGDAQPRGDVATASLTANAVLMVDTTVRSAPHDPLVPQGTASKGAALYLLGRSLDGNWLLVLIVGETRSSGWVLAAAVETTVDVWELPAFGPPAPAMPTPWGDVDSTTLRPTRA
jgi:hypothetical protein